jgi:hypothetical protein
MSSMRRIAMTLAAGVVCRAEPLVAQRVLSSVDVAGMSVQYGDSVRASGMSIQPAFRMDWTRATLGGNLEVSGLGGGNVSTQGTLTPSVFTPSVRSLSAEFAGSLGGSTHQDGTHTGQMLGVVRGYWMGGAQGLWAGAGIGQTWDGSLWRPERQLEIGGWIDRGNSTSLAMVTPVVVADSIRYTDMQIALRYPVRSYEFGLSVGARAGDTGPQVGGTSRAWGSLSAVAWLSETVAITAGVGTYPVDLTQGFPGGRFATVALRFASRDTRTVDRRESRASTSDVAAETPGRTASAFNVQAAGANRQVLRVRAPGASRVEISGDFTQWQPIALSPTADGWWTTTQTIRPGTYQMNLRINGGAWVAPPGLLTTRDEFGTISGILIIE